MICFTNDANYDDLIKKLEVAEDALMSVLNVDYGFSIKVMEALQTINPDKYNIYRNRHPLFVDGEEMINQMMDDLETEREW